MSIMSDKFNIALAHIYKLFSGLSLGPYRLFGYIIAAGTAFHFGQEAFSLALIALAFGNIIEFFIEVACGYKADKHGEKLTFVSSVLFRILFFTFILMSVTLMQPSPFWFTLLILAGFACHGFSFSLLGGNYEEWLQKQCSKENALKHFSINYAMINIGVIISTGLAIFYMPVYQYESLFEGMLPILAISILLSAFSVLLILSIKNVPPITFNGTIDFVKSFFKIDFQAIKASKKEIHQVHKTLKQHKSLSHLLWLQSLIVGIDISYVNLVSIYVLVSNDFSIQHKFIILVICYYLPNVIGSLTKSKNQSESSSAKNLSMDTKLFFLLAIAIALVAFFPFFQTGNVYLDPVFITFCCVITLFQMITGRVIPHYHHHCSDYARQVSELPKTLLSFGEKRKKLVIIFSLLITASAGIFKFKEAYFMILGLLSLGSLFYAEFYFRKYAQDKPAETIG